MGDVDVMTDELFLAISGQQLCVNSGRAKINLLDYRKVSQECAQYITTDFYDLDGDGVVTAYDVAVVMKQIMGG